jgi:2,4-dichlorophenol 6-monooxygenase
VRPDRFIAYRSTSLAADPEAELRRVLSQILGTSRRGAESANIGAASVPA